jgi:hypothetical protein
MLRMRTNGRAGTLRFQFSIPHELTALPQKVTITANGAVVDALAATQRDYVRTVAIPAGEADVIEVRITTTATISPARAGTGADTRELGLCLWSLEWKDR